jgi:hypothetical protein
MGVIYLIKFSKVNYQYEECLLGKNIISKPQMCSKQSIQFTHFPKCSFSNGLFGYQQIEFRWRRCAIITEYFFGHSSFPLAMWATSSAAGGDITATGGGPSVVPISAITAAGGKFEGHQMQEENYLKGRQVHFEFFQWV